MSNKSRICNTCGRYVLEGEGALVEKENGDQWFIHRMPPCGRLDDGEWLIWDEAKDGLTEEKHNPFVN